jgi:hypothetical protein
LGFDYPKIELPNNFEFISMGKQSDFDTWSGPIIKYFNNTEDDYFFLCFEDHFIVDYVNMDLFNEGISYLKENNDIDKVYLTMDDRRIHSIYNGNFYNTIDIPHCLVTTSLLPSVWRKSFFMRLLDPAFKTPHQFEILNNPKILNCKVIQPNAIIYPNVDAVRAGRYNDKVFEYFKKGEGYDFGLFKQYMRPEVLKIFKDMKLKWQNK